MEKQFLISLSLVYLVVTVSLNKAAYMYTTLNSKSDSISNVTTRSLKNSF